MMMTFITQRGEGRRKTNKKRKATKSEGRGLEEGASRALMRQVREEGCRRGQSHNRYGPPPGAVGQHLLFSRLCSPAALARSICLGRRRRPAQFVRPKGCRHRRKGAAGAAHPWGSRCPRVPHFPSVLLFSAPLSQHVPLPAVGTRPVLQPDEEQVAAHAFFRSVQWLKLLAARKRLP